MSESSKHLSRMSSDRSAGHSSVGLWLARSNRQAPRRLSKVEGAAPSVRQLARPLEIVMVVGIWLICWAGPQSFTEEAGRG